MTEQVQLTRRSFSLGYSFYLNTGLSFNFLFEPKTLFP